MALCCVSHFNACVCALPLVKERLVLLNGIKRAIMDQTIVSLQQVIISLNPLERVILDMEPGGFCAAVTLVCLHRVTSLIVQLSSASS